MHNPGIGCWVLLYPSRKEIQITTAISVLRLCSYHAFHSAFQVPLVIERGRGRTVGANPHPAFSRHAQLLDLLEDRLCVLADHADQVDFWAGRFQLENRRTLSVSLGIKRRNLDTMVAVEAVKSFLFGKKDSN